MFQQTSNILHRFSTHLAALLVAYLSALLPLLVSAQVVPVTPPPLRDLIRLAPAPGAGPLPPSREIHFPRQFAGDCVMDGTKVTVSQDGTVKFEAVVFSHHPSLLRGDIWHVGIDLVDKDRVILNSQSWDSPSMQSADLRIRWTGAGHFDPALYPAVRGANIANRC